MYLKSKKDWFKVIQPQGCTDCGDACSDGCGTTCTYGCGMTCETRCYWTCAIGEGPVDPV